MKKITIGTRGSRLALLQTQLVSDALQQLGIQTETKIITTKGDVNQAPIPTDTIGKAWFTAEIETALQDKQIDLAIHSLKDLPPEETAGLVALPVLARADARDTLVTRHGQKLHELPPGAVVGTDSLRRQACILQLRPDVKVQSVRGNVETRLRKLEEEGYDALVLAAAGLERLGLRQKVHAEILNPATCVPAIGQGVLAAQLRSDDTELRALLERLQKPEVVQAVAAEQAFSRIIGGGCKQPVGCYGQIQAGKIQLYGMAGTEDASRAVFATTTGEVANAEALARELAQQLVRELG